MSKEIKEFIEKLKDWKKNFPIQDYDYTKYDCEVADIAKWQKENNINELINFWNEKCKNDYFELKHPIYNNVITRAVSSINADDFNNWVFFIDEKNKYPFCIGQTCSLINILITNNNFFIIDEGWKDMCVGSVHILSAFLKNNLINFEFKKNNFGFTLQNTRPAHFFNHILNHFLLLKHNKIILKNNTYFLPKKLSYIDKEDCNFVCFYPTALMNHNLKATYDFIYKESLSDYSTLVDKDPLREDNVNNNKAIQTLQTNNQDITNNIQITKNTQTNSQDEGKSENKQDKINTKEQQTTTSIQIISPNEALKQNEQDSIQDEINNQEQLNNKQPYDLIIWLGLPGERRAWLEQIQGTASILKHFNRYFNKIKVYIDGMTAYDGERKDFPENKALFVKVLNATKELLQKEYNNTSINTNSYNNDIYDINSKDYHEREYTLNSDISILDFDELKELELQSQDINNDNHTKALEKLSEIKSKEKLIVFKSLAGYDYRTKICYCNDCDIAISDSGTTALVPFEFHKKPGVIFYGEPSAHYINFSKNLTNATFQRAVDEKLIKQVDRKSFLVWNYHIPPQHIYNLAAEVLEELSAAGKLKIKNLKMHRLEVPPVELIAKQYELEQKLGIKLSIENIALYNELEKQINTLALNNNANNTLNSNLQHSLQTKDQIIQNLENKIKDIEFKLYFKTAKARIQNHLAYKLGSALIENSKSIFGYIRMPFVLSYIRDKHRLEQKKYEENIKKHPELTLPPLEDYLDYEEALKEKECFTYKLGLALMRADKEWYKGRYIKFYFESRRMKKEFLQRKINE